MAIYHRYTRPEREPEQPEVRIPDTPAEAVYLAAIVDARRELRAVIGRLPVGSGTRERLVEVLSRLSDAQILAEVPR